MKRPSEFLLPIVVDTNIEIFYDIVNKLIISSKMRLERFNRAQQGGSCQNKLCDLQIFVLLGDFISQREESVDSSQRMA